MTLGTFSMLASSVFNKHLHLAFIKPKALSKETRKEDNTLLNHFSFLDKAVVKLNGLTNQLRSGKPPSTKIRGRTSTFRIFLKGTCKICPDSALSSRFICLGTLVSCMLPGKPVATSKKQRLAPTTASIFIEYLCFLQ